MQIPPTNSDEQLRASILTALAQNEHTRHADLRVGVLHSIAHLAGVMETLEDRSIAEEIAHQTTGVREVVNRIDAPGAPSPSREINLNIDK